MSAPTIPPRPTRAQPGPTAVKQELAVPQVPPRPAHSVRKSDQSPDREAYTRSPLNFLPNSNGTPFKPPPPPSSSNDEPRRPSSIAFPSYVGEEGLEYTSYDQLPPEAHNVKDVSGPATAEQTRNVSADVPLHQPKASVPQSTAKSRIATVTRTDSTQAAAAGIGKSKPDDDVHKGPSDSASSLSRVTSRTYDDTLRRVPSAEPHPLRAEANYSRSSSSLQNGTPRPPSLHSMDHHHGIPEIGMQIPLYKNAGDVQAPSPAPQAQFASGIGFFNDGAARSHPNHHRRRSTRPDDGGYGLHSHDAMTQDQFEKAWHAKHPDEAMKEAYNPYMLRPETALSTEQLNRIVSEEKDIGMGTSHDAIGIPTHDIAYQATQEFASRHTTPQPSPLPSSETKKRTSSGAQAATESPLRKAAFPFGESGRPRVDKALESEDDDVIHVGPSARRGSKTTGGGPADNTIDLGPTGGNTEEAGGWFIERGEGTPILASDELLKRPSSAFLQPAVNPEDRSADDSHYDSDDVPRSRRNSLRPTSRPSSRPNSVHGNWQGGPLHRFVSHDEHHGSGMGTPLEEIEEYEPLFPEDEKGEGDKPRAFKTRPGFAQHHFPSQDIWEDTPSSLQYQAYVHTPEPEAVPEKTAPEDVKPSAVFETPEQEEARKMQNPHDMTSDSKTFSKPHYKPGVLEEFQSGRPGIQRFPSQDIWEDTPDSMRLETTVSSPQMDEARSPPEDRPTTSAPFGSHEDDTARSTTGFTQTMRPNVPVRPERKSKLAQEIKPESDPREKEIPDLGTNTEQAPDRTKPMLPDRPKPIVPARPARHSDHTDGGAPLTKSPSVTSAGSDDTVTSPPAAPKTKPAVPARPAGSKIAALQSGFMNDLNNRLKLGPQGPAPKAKEAEDEAAATEASKEPLVDARKSRARGPARRKPGVVETGGVGGGVGGGLEISAPVTVWHIDEDERLNVTAADAAEEDEEGEAVHHGGADGSEEHDVEPIAALERALTENEKANTREPAMLIKSESMSVPDKEGVDGHEGSAEPPAAAESTILPLVAEEHKAVPPELSAASSAKEAGPDSASASAEDEHTPETHATPAHDVEGKHGVALSAIASPEVLGSETAGATAHTGGEASTSMEGDSVAREAE
ncbi:hypothetical protein LTR91_018017 [Friedmanniomyces endolithicus]|uniref:Altered inheritance of mitochondria protein 21 n=1 Tax=Friedmanniomyces endolithicus TaxID=329885 RepID=A0AAN6HE23_9PEZI|nr:hypothetical protein LTR94_008624 [Friedmanniomyces endolithicus]KAK0791226.1 hypothetical protein LTR59_008951 [Friedmanniomyces endolithicus]KAK0797487.1 hypothetical protein LTR38_008190 [Friedmanniomyces endolithicus]KAK0816299.1 hypothetical protein LTR75_003523 [Friedmanniomyces endolithicus]KAK0857154.1 hypothetical protein LTS02_010366 [Friedmanniomyces endolithicus]